MDFFDSVASSLTPVLLDLGEWSDSVRSFIGRIQDNLIVEVINLAFLFVGGLLIGIGLPYHFYHVIYRDTLFIKKFIDPEEDAPFHGSRVADQVEKQIRDIQAVHKESELRGSGEVIEVLNTQGTSENVGSRIGSFVVSNNPFWWLVNLVGWMWPRLELGGTAGLNERELLFDCHLTRRKRNLATIRVEVNSRADNPELELTEELAHRIVMELVQRSKRRPGARLGTRDWKAFKAHTEALRLWQGEDVSNQEPEYAGRVGVKLNESIRHDGKYALARYNLGVRTYLPLADPKTNTDAREHFLEAVELARESGDEPTQGLAWMGVSRCYSQEVHRFGRIGESEKARDAAAKADRLLPDDPRTMYACAFAWHCTEELEDIKKGRTIYEKIIKKYPGKYSSVYNNLGYILMVGGEQIQGEGDDEEANAEARIWWDQAECNMKKALAFRTRTPVGIRYTNANLGNLHRLRGCYDKAFDYYEKALEDDPEYTSGLNELARLYFELDDMAQGFHYHERALYTLEEPTTDEDHQKLKLMREVHEFLKKKGHPAAGEVGSLYEECSKEAWPRDTKPWLKELARILHVDVE